jgi:hypothetical protein
MLFSKELRFAGHVKRFLINRLGREGWEVREEEDRQVVKQVCYTDWHRVERALSAIMQRVSELEAGGWRDTPAVQ